ncbi:hypothetical protein [Pseudomonas luteola]|uniref:hypothetical protein n=1 Tax=Pseudomonas luteola TaxID=47886 RepID=UPI003F90A836
MSINMHLLEDDGMDGHEKYKALTGKSWTAAVTEWNQLEQRVQEAATQYLECAAPHQSDERKQLETALRSRHSEADVYWKKMWEDLDRC